MNHAWTDITHEMRVFGSSQLWLLELFIFTEQLGCLVLGEGVVYHCLISNDMGGTMPQQNLFNEGPSSLIQLCLVE